jgi:hypothetical protein
MNKIFILAIVVVAGWYGNSLYQQNDLPFMQNSKTYSGSGEQLKCITKDGRVLYGSVPQGTVCEKRESVKGSLTIVSSEALSANQSSNQKNSSFKCDGRQHCGQMNSRAEAEYFVKNCPNTKMDGDHDGIPCENDSRF